MSIQNYGKKLINEQLLFCNTDLKTPYDYHKIWTPDFMESIVWIKSKTNKYTSALHFFWSAIFHEREINNKQDAEEIFTETHLYKSNLKETLSKINTLCPSWYKENKELIPDATRIHLIWNETNDVAILFEDNKYYYLWSWDCSNFK